jgi:hypothetical protein
LVGRLVSLSCEPTCEATASRQEVLGSILDSAHLVLDNGESRSQSGSTIAPWLKDKANRYRVLAKFL